MGRDGEEFISVETLGDLSGRFSYEFVCGISKRVPRVYIKDGKECGEEESFSSRSVNTRIRNAGSDIRPVKKYHAWYTQRNCGNTYL